MGCACTKNMNAVEQNNKSLPGTVKSRRRGMNERESKIDGMENYDRIVIKPFSHKKNHLYHISPHNWLKIIDYLNFRELIEVGKLNR